MREYINTNIKVIKRHLTKRTKKISKLNCNSIREEFKEWNDPLFEDELIWTLPDLTRIGLLEKRSDKKFNHLDVYYLSLDKSIQQIRQNLIL